MFCRQKQVACGTCSLIAYFAAEAQSVDYHPLYGEVVEEVDVFVLVEGVERRVIKRITHLVGSKEVGEGFYDIAVFIIGVVVRLLVYIVLERAIFAFLRSCPLLCGRYRSPPLRRVYQTLPALRCA